MSEESTLLKRSDSAWSDKAQWTSIYDDAYSLALPQRNTFSNSTAGATKNATVYDSTLQKATIKLAGTLQTTITPPFTKWAKLIPGAFLTENREEAAKTLDKTTDALFAAMQPSNFDVAAGEFYLDLIIGTGAMLVLEGDDSNPFKFITVPIAEIALEEGADSKIGAIYRKYSKPARVIEQMWPDFKPSHEFLKLKNEDPGKKVEIQEITYYDPKEDEWVYVIMVDKIEDTARYSVRRTYDTNPWIISRWIKCAGETFGRGPVLNALPDAKTANMAKKLELQNASLAIAGVWMARNNGVMNGNAIKMTPGAVIPVMSTGGAQGADLQRLDVGGDVNYSQIVQKDLQQNIKEAMFDRSIPDQGAVRSATEWVVRQQELQEAIGSPFGRLHQEFIRPLFQRMLDILQKKGVIDEIPLNGGTVDVQIIGALAQAQAMKEVESINNWGQMAMALTGPEAFMATAKVENIPKVLGDLLGIPADLIRTEEEKKELAQAAAQAQAQAQPPVEGQPVQ
jgi:hypothetical protein